MMKTVRLIIPLIFLFACEENGSPITKHEPVLEAYAQDATELYFREVLSDNKHPNYNNPILDTVEISKILKIIEAVFNSDSPQRDTVFDVHAIHAWSCNSFNWVALHVKPDFPEIENLVKEIIPTGNKDLDNILIPYHFDSVITAYNYPSFAWLTLYSRDKYNMIPIADKFKAIPAIIQTEMGGCMGDGNDIQLTRQNNSASITFSIGRGDCPAGCIYRKYWEFQVVDNKATFIKTY